MSTNLHIQELNTVAIQASKTSGSTYHMVQCSVFHVDGERGCKCLKNVWGEAMFTLDTDFPLFQSQWWVQGKKNNTLKFVCCCGAAIHSLTLSC